MGKVTILGQHISTVRPSTPPKSIVYKNERPRVRYGYKCRRTTTVNSSVAEICVRTVFGDVFSIDKGTHYQVCEKFDIDFNNVAATGWKLADGSYYWR